MERFKLEDEVFSALEHFFGLDEGVGAVLRGCREEVRSVRDGGGDKSRGLSRDLFRKGVGFGIFNDYGNCLDDGLSFWGNILDEKGGQEDARQFGGSELFFFEAPGFGAEVCFSGFDILYGTTSAKVTIP